MQKTQRLGRYHLLERIAYGGMAEIFRAFTHDREGHRLDVAIKKLLPTYVEDKQFIVMITDEFKLVSHLKHPNIAEVYELTELDNNLLIAMEYVDGKDLRSVVEKARRKSVPLQFDDIAYLMARALDGLHHAHVARDENGDPLQIVHRDFSPSNVLISYNGNVKICDFGIAKATHNRIETKTGIIKGKVKYMSPEQAFGRKLDWRSDLFSCGSVLYELCTGTAPFHAPNEIDLIFAVREANPKPCRTLNPLIPEALGAIIEQSMQKSRSARFQSGLEFRDALLEFLRTFNPKYRRTKLSRFMKHIWATEIDRELRAMEEVLLDDSKRSEDFGRNLIAEALGPDAPFTGFNPNPTQDPALAGGSGGDSVKTAIYSGDAHSDRTELTDAPENHSGAAEAPHDRDEHDERDEHRGKQSREVEAAQQPPHGDAEKG